MKRVHTIIAGAAGTLVLVAATAFAAAPEGTFGPCGGPGGGGAGYGPMGMMHGGFGPGARGGMWGGGMGFMSEQNLAAFKTQLAITVQQEPAWTAFATKAAEQASLMQAAREQHWKDAGADTTPPARMAQHLGLMSQHLAGMQAVSTAMSELYAVLTPEQRGTADRLFGQMGPGAHGRGMASRGW
ncbi:MAG: Spy/CpxP family protein refolding chaperone [Aquincola sp.]|nr:Spy/CpxP family protein refolding chaperone [Aquincola sp.]MDH4290948.1 Spy/CpxP family protein refolding chaperone [Aquincola sp.]MDH5331124.1 Spy/CpxP family protein refolding chaperone [Aquincola sp.]